MKKLLPVLFALWALLPGCTKSDPAPAQPASLIGVWVSQTETETVVAPNGATTVKTNPRPAGSCTTTFTSGGQMFSSCDAGKSYPYTYSGTTITSSSTGPNGTKVLVLTVKVLTATNLVVDQNYDDSAGHHTLTDALTR